MRPWRLLGALALLGLLALASAPPAAGSPRRAPAARTRTPIAHVITLMQENHSFDNYFGTYPGADGIPAGTCMPVDPARPKDGCVKPFHLTSHSLPDLRHNPKIFARQYDGGRLDGFVSAFGSHRASGIQAMGHYDAQDLSYYWNIARRYVLFDRFFSSSPAGVWNQMFWVTGSPGNFEGVTVPPQGWGDLPTIFDRLEQAGVSWKFYIKDYDPKVDFRSKATGRAALQVDNVPLLSYPRYLDDPRLKRHIVDLRQYYQDLANGTLPAVAYIVSQGQSEHPPGSIQAGQHFVRGLLNALASSSAWKDSAFIWSYDDWGAWYDHVRPPQVDRYGYGFRVPALLVSAYAKKGAVDHTVLDSTSILKFIEENWHLRPLATRDALANRLDGAFDFGAAPRPPEFVPFALPPKPVSAVRRSVIFVAYGLALCLPVTLVAAASVTDARRRLQLAQPAPSGVRTRAFHPTRWSATLPASITAKARTAARTASAPARPPPVPGQARPSAGLLRAAVAARRARLAPTPLAGSVTAEGARIERLAGSLEQLSRELGSRSLGFYERVLPEAAADEICSRLAADLAIVLLDDGHKVRAFAKSGGPTSPPVEVVLDRGTAPALDPEGGVVEGDRAIRRVLAGIPVLDVTTLATASLRHDGAAFGALLAGRRPAADGAPAAPFTDGELRKLRAFAQGAALPLRLTVLIRTLERQLLTLE